MRTQILDHFSQVDLLVHAVLVERFDKLPPIGKPIDPELYFHQLCDDIISQQLAGRAAEVIFARFESLFPDNKITAQRLLAIPDQAIRDIGASWAKVKYVKDLALKTQAGVIRYDQLATMSDEEVITELNQVKGIGRWTAEMFLIFTLGREDVFSFGDLGLKKGFQKLYQVTDDKHLLDNMKKVTARWSPYRTYGSLALWSYLDNR